MKKKVNKSELVRGMVAKNPTAKAPEIFALLKKDGVAVSLPLVYQAMKKSDSTETTTAVKRGRKPGANKAKTAASKATNVAASPSSTNDLFASMKSFVDAAGDLDKAIEILSVFKK